MRRRVKAEDPNNLDSPLIYRVEVTDDRGQIVPGRVRVLDVLEPAESGGLTTREIGDRVAADGRGPALTKRTIQRALKDLQDEELVDGEGTTGVAGRWWRLEGAT
jgi:hypothetical protein